MWIDYRIVTLTLSLHFTILLLNEPGSVRGAAYGALLGAGGLYLLGVLYEALRGRAGLGDGDPAVMALIGAWTGPEGLVFVIFVAAISGSLFGGLWLLKNRQNWRETPVPFAPFLCLGGLVVHWTYPKFSPMASASNFLSLDKDEPMKAKFQTICWLIASILLLLQ